MEKRIDHGARVAREHNGSERSPEWERVKNEHLARYPKCVACHISHESKVQVHHIRPFHLWPKHELDPENLMTLCEGEGTNEHHLLIGHLDEWAAYNPHVVIDATKNFFQMTFHQIKNDAHWLEKKERRVLSGGE